MGTPTPAVADAFGLLQMDLYHHLDEAEFLALKFQEWTEEDADAARKLIPDLVIVIRGLLLDHQVRPSGNCRTCTSVWPCPVVTLIHGLVKDPQRQYVALARRVHDA
ncbi:MAG TPA: hypothetical protein VK887_16735 [Pseudonocardiaceae bacterium]|nr:hypothetical protein [Pseudonocardiaceae bacterium]